MMKNTGVTLIALVITIIVMLILAGVTISMIIGDNGIFTNAMESEKEYSKAEVAEALDMIVHTEFLNAWAKVADNSVDADVSEYFNEEIMLEYLVKEGYITAIEDEGKISKNAAGEDVDTIYKVYLVNASAVSSSVTKYGLGSSTTDGDVFTLEVQLDNGASTGNYNVYYYDSDKGKLSEPLTTLTLYLTSTDS